MSLVQIGLFDRGTAVKQQIAESINLRESFKKKDKVIQINTLGEKIVNSRTVMLRPRKSKTTDDLADLTGLSGQALMLFEQEARQSLMESSFSHMAKLVASGNYTFDRARVSSNGKFALAIKPAIGKAAILSEDDLKKQAAALGFELIPKEGGATEAPDKTVELEVIKAPEAKAPAKTKKASGAKVATAPAKQ